jgi:hypothetical protein
MYFSIKSSKDSNMIRNSNDFKNIYISIPNIDKNNEIAEKSE